MTRPEDLELEGEMNIFHRPRTALIPMVTGTLSAFGSYLVIREVWKDLFPSSLAQGPRSSMRPPLVRALLGICVVDFLTSIAFALATIPTPRWQTHVPYALGNNQTCEAQGFALQFFNVASPLYMTLLTFFYLVIIKYQWTDTHIRRVEVWAHSSIWLVSLACSAFLIPLDLYNNPYHSCWISSYPEGCEILKPDVPCERGGDWVFYIVIFSIFPLWPCLLGVAIMMRMVYNQVRKMEATTAKQPWGYTKSSVLKHENDENSSEMNIQPDQQDHPPAGTNQTPDVPVPNPQVNRSRSRAVARQAMLFVLAFVMTNALRIIAIFWFAITEDGNLVLYVLAFDVMLPMQGAFNAIVLLRTRTLRTPEGKYVQRVFNTFCGAVGIIYQRLHGLCCWCRLQDAEAVSFEGAIEQQEGDLPTAVTEHKPAAVGGSSPSNHLGTYSTNHTTSDSLDLYGTKASHLFNDSNLQDISSVDPDDSMAEMERAVAAKLDREMSFYNRTVVAKNSCSQVVNMSSDVGAKHDDHSTEFRDMTTSVSTGDYLDQARHETQPTQSAGLFSSRSGVVSKSELVSDLTIDSEAFDEELTKSSQEGPANSKRPERSTSS